MASLTPRKRLHVKTLLWSDKPDRLCPNGENPWILPYIHQGSQIRPAVLVIPGGGYQHVCHGYEGSDVAEAYFELGYNTFVLNYSCGEKHPYPDPLQDAARAVKMIRANAEKYFVDPKKIIALGFSAGGHLAGTLGTSIISRVNAENGDDADGVSPRVDGLVLCYPVVEFNDRLGHKSSGVNLLGKPAEEITDQEIARFSLIENIDSKTPPTFLFHTATDQLVPCAGTLRLTEALNDRKIPTSMMLFPFGPHGIGLGTEYGLALLWPEFSDEFFRGTLRFDLQ